MRAQQNFQEGLRKHANIRYVYYFIENFGAQ